MGKFGGGAGGGGGGAIRPRMPALVKREVRREEDAADDGVSKEDLARLQFRGFDKGKLNKSRKAERKEMRKNKKQGKQTHQQKRAQESQALHKLQEENARLKAQLQQSQTGGSAGSGGKRKADEDESSAAKKRPKKDTGARGATSKKDAGRLDKAASKGQAAKGTVKKGKAQGGEESNFMRMVREQGLSAGGDDKSELRRLIEEDEKEIERLTKKLGSNFRQGMKDDGWLDFFDSLDHLDEDSGVDDEEGGGDSVATALKAMSRGGGNGEDSVGEESEEDEEMWEQPATKKGRGKTAIAGRGAKGAGRGKDLQGEEEDSEEDSEEGGDGYGDEESDEIVDSGEEDAESVEGSDEGDHGGDTMDEDEEDEEDEEDGDEASSADDEAAKTTAPAVSKYIPPALRAKMGAEDAGAKLAAAVRNNLNKVSEANVSSIVAALATLYAQSPHNDVDECLGPPAAAPLARPSSAPATTGQ